LAFEMVALTIARCLHLGTGLTLIKSNGLYVNAYICIFCTNVVELYDQITNRFQ